MLRHGFIDRERNFTAIFDDFIDGIANRRILLDHIPCSPGIYWELTDGRVEHDVFDAEIEHTAEDGSCQVSMRTPRVRRSPRSKLSRGGPAQLPAQLARIDRVAPIVAGSIGHEPFG